MRRIGNKKKMKEKQKRKKKNVWHMFVMGIFRRYVPCLSHVTGGLDCSRMAARIARKLFGLQCSSSQAIEHADN